MAETVGVEHRGGYYDSSGALRDMVQNHMLQLVCLIAMEPPAILDAKNVRDEKFKLLESIRPFEVEPWQKTIVRGQYGPGSIEGRDVVGYRDEPDVEQNSATETYVAAKLMIDNWRWKEVPFYVRTGKRLAEKKTEIAIKFKKPPHSVFDIAGMKKIPANTLIMRIQPDEAIILSFQAKAPGAKMCVNTIEMQLNYREIFGAEMPEAYHRLLLDCMAGDQMLFMRYDSVELAWQLLEPVLKAWESDSNQPQRYPAGSESFDAADELIEADGRKWRPISTI
jgi:glucose-6-phosphate 1-dehydrogenase